MEVKRFAGGSCGCDPIVSSFMFEQKTPSEVRTVYENVGSITQCKPSTASIIITNSSATTDLVVALTYVPSKYGTVTATLSVPVQAAGTGPSVVTRTVCRLVKIEVTSTIITPAPAVATAEYSVSTSLSSGCCAGASVEEVIPAAVAGSSNSLSLSLNQGKRLRLKRPNWKFQNHGSLGRGW